MNGRILVADDESEITELIELYLQKDGYEVVKASNGIEAWNKIAGQGVDLAVIDIMMPGLDGYQLVKKVREQFNIPMIILSAKNDDNDKILGLGLGADDYITKPFNPLEVLARVQAQLRRFSMQTRFVDDHRKHCQVTIGDIKLDESNCMVYKKGIEVSLTSTEYKIICLLMKSPGRVFTKKQIFENVWKDAFYGDDNVIMVHISNLREKIEADAKNPEYIKTIRGLGYRFEKI